MYDTWLICDCNFLCRRASYAFGQLEHNGEATGVLFGFLSDLRNMQERFEAKQVVFCFDRGRSKREEIYPDYKGKRRAANEQRLLEEEEIIKANIYRRVIKRLWQEVLPDIGYPNVLVSQGYEADDFIAKACQELTVDFPDDQIMIVSADKDLLQCLAPHIQRYDPNAKVVTSLQDFKAKYGIMPADWATVKALAGCESDCIPGAFKIGESTALKYLRGVLPTKYKAYASIQQFLSSPEYARNQQLVKLPLIGTPECRLVKHNVNPEQWGRVVQSLGMNSLVRSGPYTGRRR